MEEQEHRAQRLSHSICGYLWPALSGILLFLIGYGTLHLFGKMAFLHTHSILSIGMMVCMLASVVYTIRLMGKEGHLAPRWVFFVNFCFGPLPFGFWVVAGTLEYLSSAR